ncbi:Do family serine endopeptidase [Roseibium suaedae]|uniref:Probable periplasmic serine endoprotease DegP-like n=1 Tax=Roseibium suaedae TaxID=735517 RepID=A0A1M7CF60_9HYPH|nr:Do family serine endopeptidase [Roseibium suaedae]SHL65862.1 serine protease Do [Roseibium suaedae]
MSASEVSSSTTAKKGFFRRRKTQLLAGVMALGMAGALSVQTIIPNQLAFADPVQVQTTGPADFSPVVKAVQPAVVSVKVKQELEPKAMAFGNDAPDFFNDLPDGHPLKRFFRRFGEDGQGQGNGNGWQGKPQPHRYGMAQGSGFFITDDGYLVTNQHVVDKGTQFTVVTDDGTEYDAKLVGADKRTDLALLKVDANKKFTYVKFAEDAPVVGEWVLAIGNPFGLGGSVTAGIVSARGRDIGAGPYDDFIQIDAPINHGNSGGPAFNMKGEVIGINAAIYSPSGGNVGIAFAIPASTAEGVVKDLKDDGSVVRGWLGVQIQAVGKDIAESLGLEEPKGAIVAEAQDGSPAAKAGLKAGDTILAVDGTKIDGPRELSKLIAHYAPDTKVDVTVWRDGKTKDIEVTLGKLNDPDKVASAETGDQKTSLDDLGLALVPADQAGEDGDGVVVADIDPDGPAAEKGLRQGDRIVEANGMAVHEPADVSKALTTAEKDGRKAVLFRIEGENGSRFVALPVKAG